MESVCYFWKPCNSQPYVIAPSACVDVSNVDVSDINDECIAWDIVSSSASEEILPALLLTSEFTKHFILIPCTPFNTHPLQCHHYLWFTATEALAYFLTMLPSQVNNLTDAAQHSFTASSWELMLPSQMCCDSGKSISRTIQLRILACSLHS
jgi:hypothetical protein